MTNNSEFLQSLLRDVSQQNLFLISMGRKDDRAQLLYDVKMKLSGFETRISELKKNNRIIKLDS